jgi:arylsulfatase
VWDDPAYDGKKGYVPHPAPRACYAAMVSRMDRDVGRIVQLVKQLHLENDTLIIFTSDNGPTFAGGADSTFFASTGGLRGLKQEVYEGGIRVPFIAAWPGHIKADSQSQHASAFWDFLPTACELIGSERPAGIDGISYLPTLLGRPERQKMHDLLYWELAGRQAVRQGDWKAVRLKKNQPAQLYNLALDPFEKQDVAGENPERLQQMTQLLSDCRTDSEVFPL